MGADQTQLVLVGNGAIDPVTLMGELGGTLSAPGTPITTTSLYQQQVGMPTEDTGFLASVANALNDISPAILNDDGDGTPPPSGINWTLIAILALAGLAVYELV